MNKNKLKRIMKYFILIIFCVIIFFTKNIQAEQFYFQAENYENTNVGNPPFAPWVVYSVFSNAVFSNAVSGAVFSNAVFSDDSDASNASGGAYIMVPDINRDKPSGSDSSAGQAWYTFTLTSDANINVHIRVIFPGGSADSLITKMIPDVTSWDSWKPGQADDWDWKEVGDYSGESLDAGTYTLKILFREDGSKVDRIYITTDGTPPGDVEAVPDIPENLTAVSHASIWGTVIISWDSAARAEYYKLYQNTINDPNFASLIASPSVGQESFTLTGLTNFMNNSITYYYWVKAINVLGASNFSLVGSNIRVPLPLPNAPNFLKAEYSGTNLEMILDWSDVAFVSTYTLFWSTNNATNSSTGIAGFNLGETDYVHINSIQNLNKTNYYWVKAYNAKGSSGYSSVVNDIFVPPSTPEFSKTEYSGINVLLRWSDAGEEGAYMLYRSTDINSTNFLIKLPANITNYTDPASVLNETNYYWVKSSNILGQPYSKVTNVILTAPDAPINLTADMLTDSQDIELTWSSVISAGVGSATCYTLFRSTSTNTNTATNEAGFVNNGDTYFKDMNFPTSVTNYYWVKAYNKAGESEFSLKASNILNVPDLPDPVISFLPFDDAQIDISWSNVSHETAYTLFRSTNLMGPTNVLTGLNLNQINYRDFPLVTNTTYYYWVEAYNRAGGSGFTAVTFSTTGSNVTLPQPDLNITRLNSVYNSPVILSWADLNNETSYKVYRSSVDFTNAAAVIATLTSNVTSYIDIDPQANNLINTLYYYWIKSFKGNYTRPFTNSVFTYVGESKGLDVLSVSLNLGRTVVLKWNDKKAVYTVYKSISPIYTVNQNYLIATVISNTNYQDRSIEANKTYYYNVGYTINIYGKNFEFLDGPPGDFAVATIGVDDTRFLFSNLMEFVSVYDECKNQSIKNPDPDKPDTWTHGFINPIINGPLLGAYKFKVFKAGNTPARVDVDVYDNWGNNRSGILRGSKNSLIDGNIQQSVTLYPEVDIIFDFNETLVNILYMKIWHHGYSDWCSWNQLTITLETEEGTDSLPMISFAGAHPSPHTYNLNKPANKVIYNIKNTYGDNNYVMHVTEIECAWLPFFEEVTDEKDLEKLGNIQNKVGLTLPYNNYDNDKFPEVYNTFIEPPNVSVDSLGIFLLSIDGDEWTYIGGDVNAAAKTISFDSQSLGIFGVFPIDRSQLNDKIVNISPNRFITADGDGENDFILFRINPKNKKVKLDVNIYNLSGGLIYRLVRSQIVDKTCSVKWYGKNLHDEELSIGPYIYEVRFDDKKVENGVIILVH